MTLRRCTSLAMLGLLAGCSTSVPLGTRPPPAALPPAPAAATTAVLPPALSAAPATGTGLPATAPPAADRPQTPGDVVARSRARWVAADFTDLPGWADDAVAGVWPALRNSCSRPATAWAEVCARALLEPPADDAAARRWLMTWLQPWRLESADGNAGGLITGYFEPLIDASRQQRGDFHVPLHLVPPALSTQRPFFTREQLDSAPAAMATLRGREIAYVADPLDALVLQIQGSGRLRIAEPNGTQQTVRLAFAAHNDQPYKSVGRWLIERGEIAADGASWPAIKAWARLNPQRVQQMLWANPRVVFFREEPLPDPSIGPRGGQGVPLVPGRSIAVDTTSVPYGTPVWLDTTEPLSNTPLRRLVVAQDTGTAITGAVRADYFWGWGDSAEANAGRMKQPLRAWALWPRGQRP